MLTLNRAGFLGGSDIGAVIGVSRFKTALDVWLEKTGQAVHEVDPAKEKIFRRGKLMEPVVLDMLAEERGIVAVARNQRYVDREFPFFACEIDAEAIVDDERVNLEAKTSHPFAANQWGDEGTDEIDISYTAQALWGMGITGRKRCIFAVLIGSDSLLTYEVKRDEQLIAEMRARAVDFWNNHVLAGVPPKPINLPDVMKLFRRSPAATIEATEEVVALVGELEALKDQAKAVEEGIEVKKFEIGKYMLGDAIERPVKPRGGLDKVQPTATAKPGQHVLTYCGRELLLVNLQSQIRLDNDRIRKEYPEVAAECSKQINFYRFDPPRKKR
jgi:putative phage-type endonuclease